MSADVSDHRLVEYVRETYGPAMALRVAEIFELDPDSETSFGRSVRRSLIAEILRVRA